MKKLIFFAVMAILAISASAQVEEGFRMGVRANVGMSNALGDGDKFTVGYGAHWMAEYNFTQKFYVQSGLGLENIAHKEEAVSGTINALYLQLPIHAGYRFELGDESSLFVQAGPTLSYGIAGSSLTWNTGDENNYFDIARRFDVGIGARVGYEFSKFQLSVGTYYGFARVIDGYDYHNFNVNVGFAYMF